MVTRDMTRRFTAATEAFQFFEDLYPQITQEHFNPEWSEGQNVVFDDIQIDTGQVEKSSWGFCSGLVSPSTRRTSSPTATNNDALYMQECLVLLYANSLVSTIRWGDY
jgi:hypothetical protein